jgi:aminodeoxyfutalosine deaminase
VTQNFASNFERVILSADVVSNGIGMPMLDAGVLVSRNGGLQTVVSFGKLSELQQTFPDARVEHAGRAILPKAVNAHTHLDMTAYPFQALPYYDWIPKVAIANRHLRGLEGSKHGLGLLRDSGIAAFGDIVWDPNTMDYLLEHSEIPGIAYWEIVEFDPSNNDEVFAQTVERVRAWRKLERSGGVRVGLTPHTPFTVNAALHKRLAEFARLEGIPMQIHVGEHPSELELFRTGAGALAESIALWGIPPLEVVWGRKPNPSLTPLNHLADLGVLEAKPTLIHMVNVTEDDVKIVAQTGCAVVSCPRSNRNLECGTFPWALYAKHGVEVALGTDSIASGESLNIVDEAMAALEIHGDKLGLRNVARWAVRGGYRALGMKAPSVQRGDDFSSLTVWA